MVSVLIHSCSRRSSIALVCVGAVSAFTCSIQAGFSQPGVKDFDKTMPNAINEAEKLGDSGSIANRLLELGDYCKEHADFSQAETLYKRSIALLTEAYGENASSTGSAECHLGVLYLALSRYAEAEPLFKRAIAIKESATAKHPLDLPNLTQNLACTYNGLKRYDRAEPLFKQAIEMFRIRAPGSDDLANAYYNLAELYENEHRIPEAVEMAKQSLDIREQLHDSGPNLAMSLNVLGRLYAKQNNFLL